MLGAAYVAFKRRPPQLQGGKGTWQYPRFRRLALFSLIIIPLLAAGGVAYYIYRINRPPTKIIVLVANFGGPDPQRYGVTDKVLNQLHQALGAYNDVGLEPLGSAITEANGNDLADSEGKKHKAAIVIWGWYHVTAKAVLLSANFRVLRPPELLPELGSKLKGNSQTIPISELENFTLQTKLAEEMAYWTLFTVGTVRLAAGDPEGAIGRFTDALGQGVEAVPRDLETLYFYRGLAYSSGGQFAQAIPDYTKAIALDPRYAKAYLSRGDAYNRVGNLEQAMADFSKAIQLEPKSGLAYYDQGVVYSKKGQRDKALTDYTRAIDLDPSNADAYNNRGNLYRERGELNRAFADFDRAIHLNPKFGTAYLNRGIAYFDKGDYKRAITDYTKAIALNPKDDFAYNNRGNAYRVKGNFGLALTDLNKAIELNFQFADPYLNRGLLYRQKGPKSQAIDDFETYLRLRPEAKDRAQVEQWLRELRGTVSPAPK